MRAVVVAIAAVAFALTGCSTSDAPGRAEASLPPSASAETTPTASESGASVNEWASLVAQERLRLDDALKPWDDNTCSSGSLDYVPCMAYLVVLQMTARISAINLGGAADPAKPTYLGEAPDEVADLVVTLVRSAEATATAGDAAVAACPAGDTCRALAFDFTRGIGDLREAYAAWEPYL